MQKAVLLGDTKYAHALQSALVGLYDEVLVLGRHYPPKIASNMAFYALKHPEECAHILSLNDIEGADVFCALGVSYYGAFDEETFWQLNVDAPLALAKAAKQGKARRFFFLSSHEAAKCPPKTPMGHAKAQAEKGILAQEFSQCVFLRARLGGAGWAHRLISKVVAKKIHPKALANFIIYQAHALLFEDAPLVVFLADDIEAFAKR